LRLFRFFFRIFRRFFENFRHFLRIFCINLIKNSKITHRIGAEKDGAKANQVKPTDDDTTPTKKTEAAEKSSTKHNRKSCCHASVSVECNCGEYKKSGSCTTQ
jgi:hypothetical protein